MCVCVREREKMEGYKHFSHTHNLNHHQVPQGTTLTCSGCKITATGTVYACWQCKFFLHENCFRAKRSLIHPSHPSHPLTLAPYPTYPSNSFYCNTCTLIGTGFSYSCSHCEFDVHIHCANYISSTPQNISLPNKTPSLMHHPSVPNHYQTPDLSTHAYTERVNSISRIHDADVLAEQLAAAQLESKMKKKFREDLLKSYDPPGTKYKYDYI